MNLIQTIIIAIVQGITELFPISSVAHGVLTPYVFHWDLDPEFLKVNFLPFVVMLHLGTALALLLFFWREWVEIIKSLFSGNKKVLILVIVATLPAAIIGLALEKPLTHLFSNVTTAAIFLIVNGFFLYFGESLRSKGTKEIEDLTFKEAAIIGLFQSLALIPGFSRSGSSMTAGFWHGLKHEASAKFSMILATPIIAGASILEVPKILKAHNPGLMHMSLLGGLIAGVFAFLAVTFLMKWFKTKEINAMRPFSYYCWAVGIIVLITRIF